MRLRCLALFPGLALLLAAARLAAASDVLELTDDNFERVASPTPALLASCSSSSSPPGEATQPGRERAAGWAGGEGAGTVGPTQRRRPRMLESRAAAAGFRPRGQAAWPSGEVGADHPGSES